MRSVRHRLRRRRGAGQPAFELTDEDRRYLTSLYDDSTPLPEDAEDVLTGANSALQRLRASYAANAAAPTATASRWNPEAVDAFLDLRYFRGETLITWHYRELPRISRLKYFVMLSYVAERDSLGLLDRLEEDGAFGCWTFGYEGHGVVSRDLLESVNEISFLERQLSLSDRSEVSVLDIGAGYGRLAHRFCSAFRQVTDYCCVDAVAESTFLCDYYLRHRGCAPPARVVEFGEIETLKHDSFEIAVNIHSFSECTLAAVAWWLDFVRELAVPRLLIVPNEPTDLLTLETDGSRRDFGRLLEERGYRLTAREPVIDDPAVRDLLELHDHFHLFELDSPDA